MSILTPRVPAEICLACGVRPPCAEHLCPVARDGPRCQCCGPCALHCTPAVSRSARAQTEAALDAFVAEALALGERMGPDELLDMQHEAIPAALRAEHELGIEIGPGGEFFINLPVLPDCLECGNEPEAGTQCPGCGRIGELVEGAE